MTDRLTPDNVFWDEDQCEELGILVPDDPYIEDYISEEEEERIIIKEGELAQAFLNKFIGSYWGDDNEMNSFIAFYHGEEDKTRVHKGIEYSITESAYGLWNEFESITTRYIDDDLSMGCISGSRLRFEEQVMEAARERGWHLEYKPKQVEQKGVEGYVTKLYLDKVFIQKKLK